MTQAARKELLAVILLCGFLACARHSPQPEAKSPILSGVKTDPAPAAPSTLPFAPVREMLARNCTPCHVPGGKMYDRLPFDNPDVVRTNSESVSLRLKAPEDKQLFREWLEKVCVTD